VTTGVCEAEARHVTLGHIRRVTSRRPFVQLKVAVDADGFVPRGAAGRPLWISSPDARRRSHLLRAEADAILVGRGTVVADDPELTCRLPGLENRSPHRVVLASHLDISAGCKL
ncbi:MAG TPA: dihydrofolate reductase family protein, partial [Hyphomicrobiaceae bacterium]|nr:dihydrofolate reductase family protein [Hyphomicrobiaceae bacterium]